MRGYGVGGGTVVAGWPGGSGDDVGWPGGSGGGATRVDASVCASYMAGSGDNTLTLAIALSAKAEFFISLAAIKIPYHGAT